MFLVTVLGFFTNGWADRSLVAFGSSAQEVKKAFTAAGLFQEITTGAATTTLPRPSAFHYSLPFFPSKQPAWVPQEGSRVKGKILAGYLGELSSSTSISPKENVNGERKWALKKKSLWGNLDIQALVCLSQLEIYNWLFWKPETHFICTLMNRSVFLNINHYYTDYISLKRVIVQTVFR